MNAIVTLRKSQAIEERSEGAIVFHVASLYRRCIGSSDAASSRANGSNVAVNVAGGSIVDG